MIKAPSNCPSCNSVLEIVNDLLYCVNPSCPAKGFKQIEHFAKTMKIKGLGPATIEKLDIFTISEIYELSIEYIINKLGSDKMAEKLMLEIERSKEEPFNTVLPAFGIPLVGKTVSDKLSMVVNNIDEIDEENCIKAGVGPKTRDNLLKWLDSNYEEYSNLPLNFEFKKQSKGKKVICITGKLTSYATKAEAKSVLEELGYEVKDSITKEVNILVNESGKETAKTEKARIAGLLIIDNLKAYIDGE